MVDGRPTTILLIESDLLLRTVLADRLRGVGYKVIEVLKGEEAFVVLASAVPIDIVLAKRESFVVSAGLDPVTQVRTLHPHIDVIAVSGLSDLAVAICNLCNKLTLTDECAPDEFLAKLSSLMGRRRTL